MDAVRARQSVLANALYAIGLGQLIAGQREGEDLVVGRCCTAWATRRLLDTGTECRKDMKAPPPKLSLGLKIASLRISSRCARLLAARAS